jgi:hypothetical protein
MLQIPIAGREKVFYSLNYRFLIKKRLKAIQVENRTKLIQIISNPLLLNLFKRRQELFHPNNSCLTELIGN